MTCADTLAALKARLAPARRSRPGVALYYEHPAAQKAHNLIKEARAAIRNAREEAAVGVTAEQGGSALGDADLDRMIVGIERKLKEAGL